MIFSLLERHEGVEYFKYIKIFTFYLRYVQIKGLNYRFTLHKVLSDF